MELEKTILGQVLCRYCNEPHIKVGEVDGEPVTIPTALRDIVGREPGFYTLRCGHRYLGLAGLLSAQEWVRLDDGTILGDGHMPCTALKGKL
jgi:hypothetical protein